MYFKEDHTTQFYITSKIYNGIEEEKGREKLSVKSASTVFLPHFLQEIVIQSWDAKQSLFYAFMGIIIMRQGPIFLKIILFYFLM